MKYSNIGGQAVMEGVMMRNGGKYAVAVRTVDGGIAGVKKTHTPLIKNEKIQRLPIIRGIISFVDSLVLGMSSLMLSAEFFAEESVEETKERLKEEKKKTEKKAEKLRASGKEKEAKELLEAFEERARQEITKADTPIEAKRLSLPAQGEGFFTEGGIVHTEKRRTMKVFWKEKAGTDAWLWLPNLSGPGEKTYIKLKTKAYKTRITIRSEEQLYYTGSGECLIHLGYSERNALTTAKIKFGRGGDYDLSGAGILYVPMENYTRKIEALNAYPLENEEIQDGRITGTVRFDEPGILALSVLQADGWTVKVDGEKVSPVQSGQAQPGTLTANVMYQGILIPAGEHTVELTYETPGSAAGYAAAIPAMLLFLVLFVLDRRKRRKEKVRGQKPCQIQG